MLNGYTNYALHFPSILRSDRKFCIKHPHLHIQTLKKLATTEDVVVESIAFVTYASVQFVV